MLKDIFNLIIVYLINTLFVRIKQTKQVKENPEVAIQIRFFK